MNTKGADRFSLKGYGPHIDLATDLAKRLQFERLRLKKTRAGEELTDEEEKLHRQLATEKSRMLDKMFQNMAELLFFFESIAAHEELQDAFGNDLADLMGLKQEKHKSHEKQDGKPYTLVFHPETFRRLLTAIVTAYSGDDRSFRLMLPFVMQEVIYGKILQHDLPGSRDVSEIMQDDILRAVAWTRLYASHVIEEDTAYHRAVAYSLLTTSTSRSFKAELDQYGRFREDLL